MSTSDVLLLSILDAERIEEGVNWNTVSNLVDVVKKSGRVSKDIRYSLKARIKSKHLHRILNTLTVLHTISMNGDSNVRNSLVDLKFIKMLRKLFYNKNTEYRIKQSIYQIIIDWVHVFKNEKLGVKSIRLLNKIQKCEEMISCQPSPCAITKLNDILLGIPMLSFTRGLDFIHTDIIPFSTNINTSKSLEKTKSGIFQNSIKRLKSIFSRSPSLPIQTSFTPELISHNYHVRMASSEGSLISSNQMNKDNFMDDIPEAIQELNSIINSIQMQNSDTSNLDIYNHHYLNSGIKIAEKLSNYQKKIQMAVTMHVEGFVNEINGSNTNERDVLSSLDGAITSKLLDASDTIKKTLNLWEHVTAGHRPNICHMRSLSGSSIDILSTDSSINDIIHNESANFKNEISDSFYHLSTPIPLKKYTNNGAFSFPKEIPIIPVRKEETIPNSPSHSLNIIRDSRPFNFENSQLNTSQFNILPIIEQSGTEELMESPFGECGKKKNLKRKLRRTYSDTFGMTESVVMPPALKVRLSQFQQISLNNRPTSLKK